MKIGDMPGSGPWLAGVPSPLTPDQLLTFLFNLVNVGYDNQSAVFNFVGQGERKPTALQRTRASLLRCSDKLFHPVGFPGVCTSPMASFKTFLL